MDHFGFVFMSFVLPPCATSAVLFLCLYLRVLTFDAELRELLDRLVSWVTLCLPANDHPLSVSHRLKLKRFKVG